VTTEVYGLQLERKREGTSNVVPYT
jgi:hypothetical protein